MMSEYKSPITPTVGRVVLVRGTSVRKDDPEREYPALITRVWGENCINVHIFNDEAGGVTLTSVQYVDAEGPVGWAAWRWMDYQKKVAAEQAEKVEATGEKISDYRDDNRRRDALSYAVEVAGSTKDHMTVLDAAREFLHFLEGEDAALLKGSEPTTK